MKAGVDTLITNEAEYLYEAKAKDTRSCCCRVGQEVSIDQLSKME